MSSRSPTADVNVEWPPGVANWVPGWNFAAAVVHVRRMFPGTIIRSLATTHQVRSALPIRPIFSEWEMRETGPQRLAFIRPWWWRGPNQNVIMDNNNPRGVYGSVVPGTMTPSGAIMGPRTRLTASLRVPGYRTTPITIQPTSGSNPAGLVQQWNN
jgi:hypothetical protein